LHHQAVRLDTQQHQPLKQRLAQPRFRCLHRHRRVFAAFPSIQSYLQTLGSQQRSRNMCTGYA
jgi:hypothetical protein